MKADTAVEIAGILKKSENTVYTWLDWGRKELKKQLGGEWIENKFRSTFDKIYAEEELKEKTADFLSKEIRRRKPAGRIFRQRLIGACAAFAVFLFISGLSYFTPMLMWIWM